MSPGMRRARAPLFACALSFIAPSVLRTAMAQSLIEADEVPQASAAGRQATLSGDVVDATGAAIPGARLRVHNDAGDLDATSDGTGHFSVRLAPGSYVLTVEADGFRMLRRSALTLAAGRSVALTLKLVAASDQAVDVEADSSVSTSSDANRSALSFKNEQLDTFSDDPAVMQQELEAIGGADPSNPPQLYVDGFSGGQMPPKDQIREVRINQNPVSAMYDQFGMGRVEIFTKPGASKLHGSADVHVNDSALNTRSPYVVGAIPSYDNQYLYSSLTGPLGKKTSFFANVLVENNNSSASVNATTIDPSTLQTVQVAQAVPANNDWQSYRGRIDRQLDKNDTFVGRYQFNHTKSVNSGVGQQVLAEAGIDSIIHRHIVQLSDTHIFSPHVVLDAALQYIRTTTSSTPKSTAPGITVQGSFTGGGSSGQQSHDHTDAIEVQQYFSISEGKHFVRAGMRFRSTRDANLSRGGYNGQFIFPDLATYRNALAALNGGSVVANLPANARPTLFQYTAGTPNATIFSADFGFYAEDEWKATKNLTLNYGLRLETQTAIPDHFDPAPRLGFAYAITREKAKAPMAVVRGGFGLFYTRFSSGSLLTSVRQNGVTQTSYNLTSSTASGGSPVSFYFTDINAGASQLSSLTPSSSTPYRVAPNLTSPVTYQGIVSVEHGFGRHGNLSVSYTQRRSVHQFESRNINAPMPATGVRPLGGTQNIYQYSSDGISDGHGLQLNGNLNLGSRLFWWGLYGLSHQMSNTGSFTGSSFVSNSYDIRQDEGHIAGSSPQALFTGFDAKPGLGFDVNLFVGVRSHTFFNITTGSDNNGDTLYNDRPSFATAATPAASLRQTPWGNFDVTPQPGETIIPFNYGIAPGVAFTELSVQRDFHFGPRPPAKPDKDGKPGKPGDPRYQLSVGGEVDNPLNHVNRAAPIGVLSSPDFGKSIALNSSFGPSSSANRAISLRVQFRF